MYPLRVQRVLLGLQPRTTTAYSLRVQVGQHLDFVRFAACFLLLDSGLRRNDGLMDYLGFNPTANHYTTIPNHPGDMPEGTLRAILKQADIEPEAFLQKKCAASRV